jgi:hypothetical protein
MCLSLSLLRAFYTINRISSVGLFGEDGAVYTMRTETCKVENNAGTINVLLIVAKMAPATTHK